jgi:hypothetical protein
MHRLWQKAAADLTVEQVNHHERSGVLPITFSLLHFVRGEDNNISKLILNEPTIWESGNWRAYQTSVFERTEATLAGGSIDWDRDLYGGALPPAMEGSFLWHMLGPDEIPKLVDGIEGFIYQHGIRHLGEIEHARALVGLGGTS